MSDTSDRLRVSNLALATRVSELERENAALKKELDAEHCVLLAVNDSLAELRIERDALQVKCDAWLEKAKNWMASPEAAQRLDGYRELAEKCAALEAERDALRRDAERYVWLRKRFRVFGLNIDGQHHWCPTGEVGRIQGPTLDAAIDAAMEGK